MNIKKLFLIISLFMACSTADSFAQLTKIWEIPNFSSSIEALSPHAKLGHLGGYLIDLTNGNIIDTKVNPERFHLTYSGDRYFVSNWQEKTMKVYNRYTKEFIQDLEYKQITDGAISAPDDSTMFVYEPTTHTLNFWNIYKNEFTDSFKIPNTPNVITYSVGVAPTFSYDGRYFGFTFRLNSGAKEYYFLVYDRIAKEIIFTQTIPIEQYSFVYSFMHTSNQMAYGEVIKLDGDDKPYSYIRIYDLDKREVVRNVRVGEEENGVAILTNRNDDKFIIYILLKDNNFQYFYDNTKDKISDFKINTLGSVLLSYDNFLITYGMRCYTFDWTVGVENTNPVGKDLILYPNPTTNTLNLNIEPNFYNGNWQLTDLTGQILLKGEISNNENFQLDISNLPPATYFLRISNGKEFKVEKVVKW